MLAANHVVGTRRVSKALVVVGLARRIMDAMQAHLLAHRREAEVVTHEVASWLHNHMQSCGCAVLARHGTGQGHDISCGWAGRREVEKTYPGTSYMQVFQSWMESRV